jgi:hypothetical protein
MNRYTVITAIAIVVIVIPIAHSGLSIVGTQQLEYRWDNPGEFNFFTMLNDGEMEFCNAMPFWTTFQKFEISTFYQSEHLGSYVVKPLTMSPFASEIQEGIFMSENRLEAQHIFMTFDFMFNGGNIRLDPNQFITTVTTYTPILGIIPHSSTVQMSGFDFDKTMNSEDLSCD